MSESHVPHPLVSRQRGDGARGLTPPTIILYTQNGGRRHLPTACPTAKLPPASSTLKLVARPSAPAVAAVFPQAIPCLQGVAALLSSVCGVGYIEHRLLQRMIHPTSQMPVEPFFTVHHWKLTRLLEELWSKVLPVLVSTRVSRGQYQRGKLSARSWAQLKQTDAILLSVRESDRVERTVLGLTEPAPSPASPWHFGTVESETSEGTADTWFTLTMEESDVGLQEMLTRRKLQRQKVRHEAKRIRRSARGWGSPGTESEDEALEAGSTGAFSSTHSGPTASASSAGLSHSSASSSCPSSWGTQA